jgi:hypothetical protein
MIFRVPNAKEVRFGIQKDKGGLVESGVSIPQAVRDVLIASIAKGQLPIVSVSLIFIVAILRMPATDVSKSSERT